MNLIENWQKKRNIFGMIIDVVITVLIIKNAYSYIFLGQEMIMVSIITTQLLIIGLWLVFKAEDMGLVEINLKRIK